VHTIGFSVHSIKKNYVDGHERPNVVESRRKYIEDYTEVYKECFQTNYSSDELGLMQMRSAP